MTPQPAALRILYLEDNAVDADLARRELSRTAPGMVLTIVTSMTAARELRVPPPHSLTCC